MNPANTITALRILIVPLLAYTAILRNSTIFLILFIIGGLTDALDGYVARKYKHQTKTGSALDTIADMLFYPSGLLAALFVPELAENWEIIIGVIALLGIAMTTCALRGKMSTEHGGIAKAASGSMYLFIIITLIFGYSAIFFGIVAILAGIAAVDKFARCIKC